MNAHKQLKYKELYKLSNVLKNVIINNSTPYFVIANICYLVQWSLLLHKFDKIVSNNLKIMYKYPHNISSNFYYFKPNKISFITWPKMV